MQISSQPWFFGLPRALMALALGAVLSAGGVAQAATGEFSKEVLTGGDPLESMQWPDMRDEFFGVGAKVQFDSRIKVKVPNFAEDAMNVPVAFDASALKDVKRVVVLVDRNPIRKVLEYVPIKAKPSLNFRFKLEQASPIRVAAQTSDDVWHVGNAFIEASGGGCTVPGATRADGSWSKTLNQVAGKLFEGNELRAEPRLRLQLSHPMDTGLVAGVPAFFIEEIVLRDANQETLATLHPFEPVSENPLFSFDFEDQPPGPLTLTGHDNNGNQISAKVIK